MHISRSIFFNINIISVAAAILKAVLKRGIPLFFDNNENNDEWRDFSPE